MSKQFSFNAVPTMSFRRSKFDLSHGHKTTCNVGQLIPFDCVEVLPGDTFKANVSMVARVTSSFIKPVIDTLYAEIHHFFVPYRLIYDDFEKVFGDPKPSAYTQNNFATMPTTTQQSTIVSGSIADHLGLPVGSIPPGISLAKMRAYALIYDRWFRNENVVDEIYVNTGATSTAEQSFNGNAFSPSNYMGMPAKVGRKKDLFSACLPSPQKGVAPTISFGTTAEVTSRDVANAVYTDRDNLVFPSIVLGYNQDRSAVVPLDIVLGSPLSPSSGAPLYVYNSSSVEASSPGTASMGKLSGDVLSSLVGGKHIGDVDLSQVPGANINDIRMAFQVQKMLEKDARFGTRYNEYLLGHFGVTSPDSRLQLPEYLGGSRVPINVTQVTQTSESTTTSPLANVSGYSLTNGSSRYTKGFVEHGLVMSFVVIRQLHTYQQGIEKDWFRTERNDFYDPLFANIGEQPIWQSQLYALGKTDLKDHVFGYNEAWAEYRYKPSQVTGQLRTGLTNSLDVWHFADNYANAPTLTQTFNDEVPTFVDRTLSVPSSSQDQFILDFWTNMTAIRALPTYSVPGLIDHH